MTVVAYLTNRFPSPVEWYVAEEIDALRRRNVRVIPCSTQPIRAALEEFEALRRETLYLWPMRAWLVFKALWLLSVHLSLVFEFVEYALTERGVSPFRRLKALLHTLLGVYFAALLREHNVEHIHVHHGYFSAWVAMVAARLLGVSFSMTLHGSDVLLDSCYLGVKLRECAFCFTVSDFNQRHIFQAYPEIEASKILVQRLGVEVSHTAPAPEVQDCRVPLLLAVGRLHPVKNHSFLLQACALLRDSGIRFRCLIVGDGPERRNLSSRIRQLGIEDVVTLVGHVPHRKIGAYYELADLVVLTSRSEGIPLVLMEAMARGKVVLAPAITGIPELVIDGETGYLFRSGMLEEFVFCVQQILGALGKLGPVRQAAWAHVRENFEQRANLARFADRFLREIERNRAGCEDENFVLQQI